MAALTGAIGPDWKSGIDPAPFVRRSASGESSLDLLVTGAHCANCIAKIESGLMRLEGVTAARLNLSTSKLSIQWHGSAQTPAQLAGCVANMGFGVRPFVADAALDSREAEGKFLLRCLAVAGFGTAFVVGLTDASYYSRDISPAIHQFLNWLAALVAAPVTLYAGRPFFRSARAALGAGRANMDVPISLSLVLTLALSFFQTVRSGQQVYFDAAVMLCFTLLIGRFLDFQLRHRARSAASELLSLQVATANRLTPSGDTMVVAARDLNPGDEIFLATGERAPVDGELASDATADVSLVTGESEPAHLSAGQKLYAGSIIIGVPVKIRVISGVENSLIAELARILEAGQQNRNRYVKLADRAASLYVPVVHGVSLVVFVAWLFFAPFTVALTNAITILIVTCPCALGLAVPAVQIVATSRLFRAGILVKSGDALERLAEIDTAVFDKTGTLTYGRPVLLSRDTISPDILERAAQLARASRHPFAQALSEAAGSGQAAVGAREIPGCGILSEDNGVTRRLGKAGWIGTDSKFSENSELWYREGDQAPVRFMFADTPRDDARDMIKALKKRGIECEIISGDRTGPVANIAQLLGLTRWRAEIDPKTKVRILGSLRNHGLRVLMVGDGLNDAAALAVAHVSISPASGIDATQAAADMVLRGSGLMPIVEAIGVARKARRLVFENFAFAALYNIVAIPVAALGHVTPLMASLAMAGSSLLVTLNALRAATGKR